MGPFLVQELESRSIETLNFDLRESSGLDVRSYEAVRNFLETSAPDFIFHLAAQAYVPESTSNPRRGLDVTVGGTVNVFEAVRQIGIRPKILVTGTSEEYGYDRPDRVLSETSICLPTTPYGVFKLSATLLSQAFGRNWGLEVISTRAWNHFGPGTSPMYAIGSFAKKIARAEKYGTPVTHGDLGAIRDYSDVRDIVRGYVDLMLSSETGIFNLASGQARTIQSVLDALISLANSKVATAAANSLKRNDQEVFFPAADTTKVFEAIGWQVELDFESSLLETLEYWRGRV